MASRLAETDLMNSRTPKLILASQSPRRRELLSDLGFEFEVVPPDEAVERGVNPDCSPEQFVCNSATAKARFVAEQVQSGIILSADTVAECQSQVLGKPIDRAHAEQMLRLMSGQQHRVLTGVCLYHQPSGQSKVWLEQTVLRMDVLDERLLTSILDSNGWIGKAGGFGFQDGLDWLHIESGLESNVVGLPVERLEQWITELMGRVES